MSVTKYAQLPSFLLSVLCFLFSSVQIGHASQLVRYPQPGEVFKQHHLYPIKLLKLALSYSNTPYQVAPSDYFMSQGRSIKQLTQGQDIEVCWTMTSQQREAEVRPIRIPIYKGLIGWRLFLTKQLNSADSTSPISLTELKKKTIIQGHDWPDTEILKYNEFNIHSAPNYEGLFKMISLGRADLFPRSVIEIWDELNAHASEKIDIEKSTLISYPTATYFFVSKHNKKLAAAIDTGLRKALDDGNFDKLFLSHYSDIIKRSKLKSRQHYRLANPLLPEATPIHDKNLWFNLDLD